MPPPPPREVHVPFIGISPPVEEGDEPIPPMPLPPKHVVCTEYFIYPPIELYKKEFVRRWPELNTPAILKFIDENARIHMPPAQTDDPSSGRCAVCTCNWLGLPMKAHEVKDCPIPYELRPKFMAVNTRSICLRCRGRSDSHDRCFAKWETCQVCFKNEKGVRDHHPMTSMCQLPTDCEPEIFNMERKKRYFQNVKNSAVEPFQVRLYNDEPMVEAPANYHILVGIKALKASDNIMGGVVYGPTPNYQGLIPAHMTKEREDMDRRIISLQKMYYATEGQGRPDPPAEVVQKLQERAEAIQRVVQRRKERIQRKKEEEMEAERAKDAEQAKEVEGNGSQRSNDNQGSPSFGWDDAERGGEWEKQSTDSDADPTQKPKTPSRVRKSSMANADNTLEVNIMYSQEATEEEVKEFEIRTQMESRESPAVTADEWWQEKKPKVAVLVTAPGGIMKRMVRASGNSTSMTRPSARYYENKGVQSPYRVLPAQLKETVSSIAILAKVNYDLVIPQLQQALTGKHEKPEAFKESPKWKEGGVDWKQEYFEFLLKVAVTIVTLLPTVNTELAGIQHTKIDMIYVPKDILIPDTKFFLDIPQQHRHYSFMVYATSIAQSVQEW